jgi:hypothetical protein
VGRWGILEEDLAGHRCEFARLDDRGGGRLLLLEAAVLLGSLEAEALSQVSLGSLPNLRPAIAHLSGRLDRDHDRIGGVRVVGADEASLAILARLIDAEGLTFDEVNTLPSSLQVWRTWIMAIKPIMNTLGWTTMMKGMMGDRLSRRKVSMMSIALMISAGRSAKSALTYMRVEGSWDSMATL